MRTPFAFVCLLLPCFVLSAAEPEKSIWSHNLAATTGPAGWGTALPAYGTCGTGSGDKLTEVGMKQTPIDIVSGSAVKTAALPALTFQYQNIPLEVENTGHVVEVVYPAGSSLRLGAPGASGAANIGDEYQLLQFHFHTPSEHTIDGKRADMELHLVHSNALGDLAVVGVLMNVSAEGNFMADQIMSLAPMAVGAAKTEGATLNARQFLPGNLNYFMYSGSLTTPPCTEGVRWFVLKTPVPVSSFAVQRSKDIIRALPGYDGFESNNRPLVPSHGRPILTNR